MLIFVGGLLLGTSLASGEKDIYPVEKPTALTHSQNVFTGPLKTYQGVIIDNKDNFVFLKIYQDSNLLLGSNMDPSYGTCSHSFRGISEYEADAIAGDGFTAIRMELNWENLQPKELFYPNSGQAAYIRAIKNSIDTYNRHGLGVFLSLGERNWSSREFADGCRGIGIPLWADRQSGSLAERVCALLSEPKEAEMLLGAWRYLEASLAFQDGILGAEMLTGNDLGRCIDKSTGRLDIEKKWGDGIKNLYPAWVQLWPVDLFRLLSPDSEVSMKVAVEILNTDWGTEPQNWETYLKSEKEALPLILEAPRELGQDNRDSLVYFAREHGLGVIS